MYKWEDDYVDCEELKDGWYCLKLDLISGSEDLEKELPPSRCVFVEDNRWRNPYNNIQWDIHPDDIGTPAFVVGEEYEVSNDGIEWNTGIYNCYDFFLCCHVDDSGSEYKICREIKNKIIINNEEFVLTKEQILKIKKDILKI